MKITPRRVNKKVVPKLSLGGIAPFLGAAGGLMSTGMQMINDAKERKQQEQARRDLIRKNDNINQAARAGEFDPNGYQMNNYYARGGTPKLRTGKGEEYTPRVKSKEEDPPKSNKFNTSKYSTVEALARSAAGVPQTFNKTVGALAGLVTNSYNGKSPTTKEYWKEYGKNVKADFTDALYQTDEELANTTNLGKQVLETGDGLSTFMIPKTVSGVGKNVITPVAKQLGKVLTGNIPTITASSKLGKVAASVPNAHIKSVNWVNKGISNVPDDLYRYLKLDKTKLGKLAENEVKLIKESISRPGIKNLAKKKEGDVVIKNQSIPPTKPKGELNTISPTTKRQADNVIKAYRRGNTGGLYKNNVPRLAKGGTPRLTKGGIPGIKTDATEIPIAPGAMEVKTSKPGVDKIKANIKGSPAMIDHNELIVEMSDSTPVVISSKDGSAGKYKELIKQGYDPKHLNDVFGMRAIGNQISENRLEGGGTPDGGKYVYRTKKSLPIGAFTDEEANKLQLYNGTSNPKYEDGFGLHSIAETVPVIPSDKTTPSSRAETVPVVNPSPKTTPLTKTDLISEYNPFTKPPHFLNTDFIPNTDISAKSSPLNNASHPTKTTSLIETSPEYKIYTKTPPPVKTPPPDKTSTKYGGDILLAGAQTGLNFISALQSSNQKLPEPVLNQHINKDRNINRPLFESQRAELTGLQQQAMRAIKNNSSDSNTYLNRLSDLTAKQGIQSRSTYANQLANQNQIDSENNKGQNMTAMQNNALINQHANLGFAKRADDIQNWNKVGNEAINSAQSILDSKRKGSSEGEALKAIAASYDITIDPDATVDQIRKLLHGKLSKLMSLDTPESK